MKKKIYGFMIALTFGVIGPTARDLDIEYNQIPSIVESEYAAESKPEKPRLNLDNSINEKPVHFYNFNPNNLELVLSVPDKPQTAGEYYKYTKSGLEFMTTAGYYSLSDGGQVGDVLKDGKRVINGMYDGGAYITYIDGKINISLELKREKIKFGDWAQGGFGRLVLNHSIDNEESERRMLNFWGNEERSSFVIYDNERVGFAFYTGNLHDFAHGLLDYGVKSAVLLDSGNSRFFVYRNHELKDEPFKVLKQVNPERRIGSMIFGYNRFSK